MLRNQATALLKYEHLTTTVPKAKELRPFVERLITVAKRGLAAGEANGRVLNARRLVMEDLQDRDVVSKLFETIAPRFAERPGGYTRLMRTGYRRGDSAELAMVELIGSEFDPNAKVEGPAEEAKPKAKGVGGRLRAAAERLRGTKKGDDDSRKVTAKPTKGAGAGRRSTTPRKAGGS
jgi:large subunit ribosomal protein L17